jgi:hypothetical protein
MTIDDNTIVLINELRIRLTNSGVERTAGLGKAMSTECDFYQKSKRLFIERDLLEIKQMITKIGSLI